MFTFLHNTVTVWECKINKYNTTHQYGMAIPITWIDNVIDVNTKSNTPNLFIFDNFLNYTRKNNPQKILFMIFTEKYSMCLVTVWNEIQR